MAACDVLVNLRSPTMGETSGSVIRGLALGKPMLVSDVGWFSELPDGVALKIPVDDYEVRDDRRRARARRRPTRTSSVPARANTSAPSTTSVLPRTRYTKALEEAAGGDAVTNAVLMRIAEEAARSATTIPPSSPGSRARRGSYERQPGWPMTHISTELKIERA